MYSPCGGNGTCGKCKIYIKDEGYITSCLYRTEQDIEISLPDPAEANILVSQYKHTRQLPLNPGKVSSLSAYPLGIAIDIGTTSVVYYLMNLITGALVETRAIMNPQTKYGADVISRINYCIQNSGGLKKIQKEMLDMINDQIRDFAASEGVTPKEFIKLTVSGNTTMLHLLLGEDPSSLAFVPFKPVFLEQKILKAKELGLVCNEEAEIIILPSVSAYVGADIVSGLASLSIPDGIHNYLFIDIGTNGEMAIVSGDKIYACATAAGPAFEGANISCGMPALEGAISSFSNGKYNTIGDQAPKGICGSGLIDVTAYLVREGIVKSDGEISEEFILHDNTTNEQNSKISISQKDIRELQLAKSAILSGINILVKKAGLKPEDIEALYLAGGFGNYINIENAVDVGLIPKELKEKVIPIGNASGTGAMLALKSESFYGILESLIKRTEHIELSEDEDFALEFAVNMGFGGGGKKR